MARGRHGNHATGAFGGASDGATILVRGVPTWPEAAVRTLLVAPSVELLRGHDGVPTWPEAAMRTLLLAPS
eukprot:5941044-Pyramimonas_sp.AAC.1